MHFSGRIAALAAVILVVSLSVACGGGGSSPAKATSTPSASKSSTAVSGAAAAGTPSVSAAEALVRAQKSLDGGYTITMTAVNFPLAGWGGTDSGTVQVGAGGKAAIASLRRTGDDSLTSVRFVDNQTFYQRGVCTTWSRVPGGGADVLKPFLFTVTNVLSTASGPQFIETDNRIVVAATVPGLGTALVQMEPSTYNLITIVFGDKPDNAGHTGFTFDFSDLGKPLTVDKPSGTVPDRSPGGSSC